MSGKTTVTVHGMILRAQVVALRSRLCITSGSNCACRCRRYPVFKRGFGGYRCHTRMKRLQDERCVWGSGEESSVFSINPRQDSCQQPAVGKCTHSSRFFSRFNPRLSLPSAWLCQNHLNALSCTPRLSLGRGTSIIDQPTTRIHQST